MRLICNALLLVLLISGTQLPAQHNPQPYFRNYNTAEGLPSPEVYCAFEDSRGYMWFGTDNGAARFDGYSFRTYGPEEGLMSNVVFQIFEDKRGRIWFGSMTGEAFILEGDTIVPYRFNHLVLQHREQYQSGELVHLADDETAYFELEYLGFLVIDSLGVDHLITKESYYAMIVIDIDGHHRTLNTKIGRRGSEKQQLDITDNQMMPYIFLSPDTIRQIALPIGKLMSKRFIVEKLFSGNYLVFGKGKLHCIKDFEIIWSRSDSLHVNEIIEKNNSIWLCLGEGKGLRDYKNLEDLRNNKYDLYLEGLSVSNLTTDSKGGIWVTTQEEGIFYSKDFEMKNYDTRFGFSSDFVSSITFINGEELFVGGKDGEIFHIDISKNRILSKFANPWGYQNFDLLYQAELNKLWNGGAYYQNGQWHFLKDRREITNEVIDFLAYRLDKLQVNVYGELLSCNYSGFFVFDSNNDTLLYKSSRYSNRERTFAIHSSQKDHIWVGNTRGIFQFKDSVLIHPGLEHPAFHSRVEDIDELPDGRLVFGTKGWGVIIWREEEEEEEEEEEVIQLSKTDGLSTNMIEDVHVDAQGIIWVGTLNGLNKIELRNDGPPRIRQFTVSNGLPSNEVYRIKSNAGQLWLCTAKGLVRFHQEPKNTVSAAPMLQQVSVNGTVVPVLGSAVFSYQENNFVLQYLAINYRQDGKIPYRYRLHKDEPWQLTQNLSVNYPQLPPGRYAFEVQAQNEDGYWSPGTHFVFQISPPWWSSWWFTALMVCGLGFAGLTFYQNRIRQLQKENDIRQRMSELERSALQAQMNPHFIFNCLSSIQNFILKNDRQKAVDYLSRFAKLVRLNLDASVQGAVALEDEIKLLDNYLALEQERFEHRFSYEIDRSVALEDTYLEIPPLLIQPYVENAVAHGVAKKEGDGRVSVYFDLQEDQLSVRITDNGPGLQQRSENGKPHKSVGMSITQKRLELLGKDPHKMYRIETIKNERSEIVGTSVHILIKPN